MERLSKISAVAAGTLLAAFGAGNARAQDMGAPPPVNWSGPYGGVDGGGTFGSFPGSVTIGPTTSTAASTARLHSGFTDGGTVGGLFGYSFQANHLVWGVEGDFKWDDLQEKTVEAVGAPSLFVRGDTFAATEFWDASVRGRLGYAWGNTLAYATGGVALAEVHLHADFVPIGIFPAAAGGSTDLLVGGTVGAGAEYMIAPNVSLGLEYRFSDYDSGHYGLGSVAAFHTAGGTFLNAGVTGRDSLEDHQILGRIVFHFAPPPPAPPPAAPMPAAAPAPAPMARTFLVFFDFDRYNLTPDARRVVEAAAASYKATDSARVEVSGYTDLAGTQAYNLRLSQRRADAVATELMRQDVPKNVMDVKWFGKEHPRVPTPDGVREPQNRRVEIEMP